MDMQLDASLIKGERQKRAWSQEHLAATTGLGLRTIQRIETTGAASAESAKALAAVLELPLSQLAAAPGARTANSSRLRWMAGAFATALALVSVGLYSAQARAEDVALEIRLNTRVSGESRMNVSTKQGERAEIKLEKDLKLILSPTADRDGRILLDMELYGFDGTDFEPVARPAVLLEPGRATSLSLSLRPGDPLGLTLVLQQP